MSGTSFVSILVPALNEERYIEKALRSLKPKDGDIDYEIIVLDGGSTDATAEIVRRFAAGDSRIRLVANEKRLQSAGINAGARIADPRATIFVRADCHAEYPENFVKSIVETLERSDAKSVVVPMKTVGTDCMQRAIAAAQNSRLGTGGSPHRSLAQSRYIDHGHHAAFDREAFLKLGGYDETFTHNEDAEYDHRLGRSGGKIWMASDLPVVYFPRRSLSSLARQYFNHGKGRARTILKHSMRPKPRQMAPVLLLVTFLICLVLAVTVSWLWLLWPAAYVILCCLAGAALAWKQKDWCVAASGLAAVVMHQSWALGFLRSVASGGRPSRR